MANTMLAGFIKGFTGRQLDDIDERRKAEAEQKKLLLLQQLQRETAEWEWKNDPAKKQALKESESRIKENEAQAKRDQERIGYERDKLAFDQKLALRNAARQEADSASERSYRERSLALSAKAAGSGSSLDGSQSGTPESLAIQKIISANKPLLDTLTTGDEPIVDKSRAYNVLAQIVANSKTPADAERNFREYLNSVNNQYQTAKRTKSLSANPPK